MTNFHCFTGKVSSGGSLNDAVKIIIEAVHLGRQLQSLVLSNCGVSTTGMSTRTPAISTAVAPGSSPDPATEIMLMMSLLAQELDHFALRTSELPNCSPRGHQCLHWNYWSSVDFKTMLSCGLKH